MSSPTKQSMHLRNFFDRKRELKRLRPWFGKITLVVRNYPQYKLA